MTVVNKIPREKIISKKGGVKGIWAMPERKPFFVMSFPRSLFLHLFVFGRLKIMIW